MELYGIRHAQSTAQVGDGEWLDPDLTEFGREQAQAAASYFANQSYDLVLISPLRRTRRTYKLAAPTASEARFDSRLVECTLNRGPGYDYAEVLPYATPDWAVADQADMWTAPAGTRVASLLAELRESAKLTGSKRQRVLLVAHNGFLNVLRWHVTGLPILGEPTYRGEQQLFYTDNTGISGISLGATEGEDTLLFWNEPTSPLTRG